MPALTGSDCGDQFNKFCHRVQIQLFHDLGSAVFDASATQPKFGSDQFIDFADHQQFDHIPLFVCQR